MRGAEPSTTPDPSKKYWWVVGVLVPIVVALIGAQHYCGGNNRTSPTVLIQQPNVSKATEGKPPCSAKLREEHDDAQKAVHEYDNFITDKEAKLTNEKNMQAMADSDNDKFKSDEHRELAAYLETAIAELKENREHAAQRVRDIEQQCSY